MRKISHSGRMSLSGWWLGAGNPEYMTLMAVRILRGCDIIAIPTDDKEKCFAYSVAVKAVPQTVQKPVLSCPLPMTRDGKVREKAYERAALSLKKAADEGKTVAFVTIGDVSVYSTYLYLHERLLSLGVNTKLVPGVTSFCAAASELGKGLCMDGDEVHIIPGVKGTDADLHGTTVYMKGNIPYIKAKLKKAGCKASAVEKCGTAEQIIYGNIDDIPDDAGYFTVIIAKETEK